MNKLDLLRSFVRVTELASFTQAGASLGLPRSTVSEHVQLLEDLLGARLLHRTTRRVSPTQDGLALYERGKDMLAGMDDIEAMFRRDDAGLVGRLRVDMPAAMVRMLVMPRLSDFCGRHPGIQIEVSSADRRVDLVREGFDCVLRVGELEDAALVARPLGRLDMVNCVSAGYAQIHGIPRTLDDLDRHTLIHYSPMLGTRPGGFEYLENGKPRQRTMPGAVTVNGTDAYEAACLGGLGLVQMPLMGAAVHLAERRLLAVLPEYVPAPMRISLLYAHRRHLPRRVVAFMDWLGGLIEEKLALLSDIYPGNIGA